MFLGPLEQAKPWNTADFRVFGFLKNYGVCIMKKTLWWSLMRCQDNKNLAQNH
jgi:hypothetical protein